MKEIRMRSHISSRQPQTANYNSLMLQNKEIKKSQKKKKKNERKKKKFRKLQKTHKMLSPSESYVYTHSCERDECDLFEKKKKKKRERKNVLLGRHRHRWCFMAASCC
jgi:hypothetical protein